MKKNILFLIIIVLIFLGFLIYGFGRPRSVSESDIIKEPQNNNQIITDANTLTKQRQEVMKYLASHIAELSPIDPVLGGSWFVTRFWWPKNTLEVKDFYVEYEDGHILHQIIVRRTIENNQSAYKTIAFFEPGEDGWDLKQGENTLFGQELELYEYNVDTGEWEKH